MTLSLSPEMLAAAYDFLALTAPFSEWNLPPSEEVLFKVGRFRTHCAHYQWNGKKHTITVSKNAIGHTDTLIRKLAHEIIHLHLEELGMDDRGTDKTHSGAFLRLAEDVCKIHGFDLKVFY